MENPKISVIMPIYNTEYYLEETLISLASQTIIDDLEVIMVDDGATDESRYIIEKYALDYDNFHAYHKENEGQGITRNYGLSLAKGEYTIFLDSDDYLPRDAYETLYEMALKTGSDIVVGNVLRFALYNVWEDNLFKNSFFGMNEVIEKTTLNEMPSLLWDTVTWNKLYKTEFLRKNNITFPDKKISFQDIPFSLKAYILAESISITPVITNYWRLRSDNTSVTQQDKSIKNFRNRLEITRMSLDILDEFDVSDEIRNRIYDKWINHDLKFNLKRIDNYDPEYQEEFISQVYDIVKLIPDEIIESQNSYKKVLFKLIKNRDFDKLLMFAPLEDELCKNPHIPPVVNQYGNDFNFSRDIKDEELSVELVDVMFNEDSLLLKFEESLNYLTEDISYGVVAKLVGEDREYPVDVDLENSQVIIPFDMFKDKNHLKVKIICIFDGFEKNAFIKNRHRQSHTFDEFDMDLDMSVDSYLFLDYRQKQDNEIIISNVSFDSGEFIIEGKSNFRVDEIIMENVIDFDKKTYPLEYDVGGRSFSFRIPHNDILNNSIKKWELNCPDCLNSIKVSKEFQFFTRYYKIRFINSRNKILIENDIVDPVEKMYETFVQKEEIKSLKKKISSLEYKNQKLESKNKRLEDTIEEFKSRKVVKFADKIRR